MTNNTESVTLLGINVQKCDATRNGKSGVNREAMRFRHVLGESYLLSIDSTSSNEYLAIRLIPKFRVTADYAFF